MKISTRDLRKIIREELLMIESNVSAPFSPSSSAPDILDQDLIMRSDVVRDSSVFNRSNVRQDVLAKIDELSRTPAFIRLLRSLKMITSVNAKADIAIYILSQFGLAEPDISYRTARDIRSINSSL
jgi:hypothetical protein